MPSPPATDSPDLTSLHDRVAANPNDARARYALAQALLDAGQALAAAPVFLKASRLEPSWLPPRLMLAKSLARLGRFGEALDILRQTTGDFPEAAEAWTQRGGVEREMTQTTAAEASFRRALELTPDDANALNNLGVALRAQDRLEEAIDFYRKALVRAPKTALVHTNLGNALDALGHADEAESHLREAVALDPRSTDAAYNLAIHLIRGEKPDDAIAPLRRILSGHPTHWQAWINLGVGLAAMGEIAEAEQCYRKALDLRPNAPEAHYNLAWVLLLSGQWREGWTEYEWRWQLPNFSSLKRKQVTPPWNGANKPDATILLQAEQGYGDTIQFVRFARLVRERCARVILECHDSLAGLLKDAPGVDQVVPFGKPLPHHDLHAHLLSLPRLLGITPESIPDATPYLHPPARPKADLVLPVAPKPRIGIVWAGSVENKIDRRRSCDVAQFISLMKAVDADFVSLQTGSRAADLPAQETANLIFSLNGMASDWVETANVVAQLDLIIGVDTAVIHLAGAMGKPVWLLLPYSPDFRWLTDHNDTPWYKSVRLFRQTARGDWSKVFKDVQDALTNWLQKPG